MLCLCCKLRLQRKTNLARDGLRSCKKTREIKRKEKKKGGILAVPDVFMASSWRGARHQRSILSTLAHTIFDSNEPRATTETSESWLR